MRHHTKNQPKRAWSASVNRPKPFNVFRPSRKVQTASCCLGGLVQPLFCKSLGRTGLADVSGQMISRSNQSRNWLATKVANSPVSKIRIIMAYGIQLPFKSVTFVPHFGHTNDRRAALRSTSQCHRSKTRKRGRAFLNGPIKPQEGHRISLASFESMIGEGVIVKQGFPR